MTSNNTMINIQGLILGDPFISPVTIASQYAKKLYTIGVIDT